MNNNELTCQDLVEIVTEYLEGALPPVERERFERHLATCDGCNTYLMQMRQTIRALGKLDEETISEPAKTDLLNLFRNWKRRAK